MLMWRGGREGEKVHPADRGAAEEEEDTCTRHMRRRIHADVAGRGGKCVYYYYCMVCCM
jgi:hypothetical protein